jgi:hypothetical protein
MLENVVSEPESSGVPDGAQQGQFMQRLVENPLWDQLVSKIRELPDVRATVKAGTCAVAGHYADTLIACADSNDARTNHYEVSRRTRTQPFAVAEEEMRGGGVDKHARTHAHAHNLL